MRDEPTAENLLNTARDLFREKLLPALPRELRYDALMVANAMAIAGRQTAAGDAPLREAKQRLSALYGDGELADLERRLAADIRAGRFDPEEPEREAVFDHLWRTTRAKAAESAPKALKGRNA